MYKLEPVKLELGNVIHKYVERYGASEAISMYNSFCGKTMVKNKNYTQQEFINKADRYMSLMFFIKDKYND